MGEPYDDAWALGQLSQTMLQNSDAVAAGIQITSPTSLFVQMAPLGLSVLQCVGETRRRLEAIREPQVRAAALAALDRFIWRQTGVAAGEAGPPQT